MELKMELLCMHNANFTLKKISIF